MNFFKDRLPIGEHLLDWTDKTVKEKIESLRDFFTEHQEADGVYLPDFGISLTREDILEFIQQYYEETGERIEW